ncbi:MAG: hypothetical protein KAI24_14445, partial [Planctomycetes bacterium]|nr:hypothetical protein [Planctomycetota bacterium]
LRELGEALTWLSDGSNWTAAADTFLEDLQLDPMPWVFVLLFLLALLVLQPRVRAALTTVGTHAERASTVSFAPTGAALAMTLLIALPLPTAMWLIGWRLQQPFHADFARALGAAFADAGWLLFGLALFRQVVRAKGLGESHFQWPQSSLTFFRRQLRWQLPLMTALVFALSLIGVGGNANWREALTRPLLLVLLGAMTMFFWRMLHPRNGVAGLSRADAPDWAKRFRIVWFVLGAGIPAALFLLAALGYHFTSKQLAFQLGETIAVVTALFLLHDVSLRALVLTRRKLAMAQAAERRKAAAAAAATASDGGDAPQPVEEQLVDVRSIADQTRSLVRSLLGFAIAVGAWLIWVDVLPALGVFKTVVVWDGITLA